MKLFNLFNRVYLVYIFGNSTFRILLSRPRSTAKYGFQKKDFKRKKKERVFNLSPIYIKPQGNQTYDSRHSLM